MLSLNAMLLAAGGFVIALFSAFMGGIFKGASQERAKQAAGKLKSAEERLEMDREATAAERAAADLSDAAARKEALKWKKP